MNALTIENNHEAKFQNHLMTELKRLGLGVIHLQPIGHSGFPDLLVTKDIHYLLVELKSIDKASSKASFGSLFEEGQLSWHAKRVQNGDRPVLTLIECRVDETIYVFSSNNPIRYATCADASICDLFPSLEMRTPFFLADWLSNVV